MSYTRILFDLFTQSRNTSKTDSIEYDLGGDVPLTLSDRVLVDGTWTSMPSGYPHMEIQGGSAIFVFRFPTFSVNATYDPTIGTGQDETTSVESTSSPSSSDSVDATTTSPSSSDSAGATTATPSSSGSAGATTAAPSSSGSAGATTATPSSSGSVDATTATPSSSGSVDATTATPSSSGSTGKTTSDTPQTELEDGAISATESATVRFGVDGAVVLLSCVFAIIAHVSSC